MSISLSSVVVEHLSSMAYVSTAAPHEDLTLTGTALRNTFLVCGNLAWQVVATVTSDLVFGGGVAAHDVYMPRYNLSDDSIYF